MKKEGTQRAKRIYTVDCSKCTFVIVCTIIDFTCNIDVFCAEKGLNCTDIMQNQNLCNYNNSSRDYQKHKFGVDANLLSLSDLKKIVETIAAIFKDLNFNEVADDFIFTPVDYRRFRATQFLVQKVCKKINWESYYNFDAACTIKDRKFLGLVEIIT